MARLIWIHPPDDLHLTPNQADIWRITLTDQPDSVRAAALYLSADETKRAANFHFEADRNRFIVAHARLRQILARYTQLEPRRLNFSVTEYGKPFLQNSNLRFNLSHSGAYALVAVSFKNIGVDVEQIRAEIEAEDLAGHYFSQAEIAELLSLPVHERRGAFFRGWARKEAYIKAQGLGLSLSLDSFDVSLAADASNVLRATRPNLHDAVHWSLHALDVAEGYAGAVAVEGTDIELRSWDWETIR